MKTLDSATKEILERAYENLVRGLSPEEAEAVLDKQTTMFLSQAEEPKLAIRVNDNQVVDSLAARYLHQRAFDYK
jgi:hypothetical protein